VVLTLLRRQEPASALARRYGISDATLYRWRDEFLEGGRGALPNGKKAKPGLFVKKRNAQAQRRREKELMSEMPGTLRPQCVVPLDVAGGQPAALDRVAIGAASKGPLDPRPGFAARHRPAMAAGQGFKSNQDQWLCRPFNQVFSAPLR